MKWLYLILAGITLLTAACGDDNPTSSVEGTDYEAITNVIILDNYRLSEITAFPETVPDTASFIANPITDQPLYWHVVDSTIERISTNYSPEQVQSPVGLVDQANVGYTIKWYGVFHALAYNQSADSIERYDKEFMITGSRSAIVQRWGRSNLRRGWLLTSISGATIGSGGGQPFLQDLKFESSSNDDSTFSYTISDLDELVQFNAGEGIALSYEMPSEDDLAYIYIPVENYSYELAEPTISGDGYRITLNMPTASRIYGQLKFYVVNAGDFEDDYRASGFSYSYKTR